MPGKSRVDLGRCVRVVPRRHSQWDLQSADRGRRVVGAPNADLMGGGLRTPVAL